MNSLNAIIAIIGILFGGGVSAAVATFIKVRPEAGQILVTTAQGAVVVQTGVIESLQRELARISSELDEMRAENSGLRARIRELEGKV